MKKYRFDDEPLKVFGVPYFEKTKKFIRLPEDLRNALKGEYPDLGRRCAGARVGFRTDSTEFTVKMELEKLTPDMGMSAFAAQSAEVIIGSRQNGRYAGHVNPPNYSTTAFEKTFKKDSSIEDIMIFLPRNEHVVNLEVLVNDGAVVEAPTPYKYQKPILYYGSSITEGGCCCRVTNAYNAIISNHLDVDYYNFGFSGSARGELIMAEYISGIDMSIFVMDYDHNAPSAQHLRETHRPFYELIRKKNPDLPIIMMSAPDFDYAEDKAERRAIIKDTYEQAVKCGDKNVYFLDGETFFGKKDRHFCTVDCTHPNDLGFYRMAQVIEPVISKILNGF